MALQGTIESFALADVARLLGSSSKTGRLIVTGDRGTAHLWFADGAIVGGDASSGATNDPVEVVFDLLRFQSGSFVFEADSLCPDPMTSRQVDATLAEASEAFAEWRDVIAVVHGLGAVVELSPSLPMPEVVVDQAVWTSVVAIGGACTVGDLGRTLGLGELPVCRLVRALHDAGFVVVTDMASTTSSNSTADQDAVDRGPVFSSEPLAADLPPIRTNDPFYAPVDNADDAGGWEPAAWDSTDDHGAEDITAAQVDDDAAEDDGADPFGDFDPFGTGAASGSGVTFAYAADEVPREEPAAGNAVAFFTDEAFRGPDSPSVSLEEALPPVPGDDELARQIAMLSPQAAQAVSTAAGDNDHTALENDHPFRPF